MSEPAPELQTINWRRCCPVLEILRSFRMAIHPVKLMLVLLGLAACFWLHVLIDQIPGLGRTRVNGMSYYENVVGIVTGTLWGNWDHAVPFVGGTTWDQWFTFLAAPVTAAWALVELWIDYWTGEGTVLFALVCTVVSLAIWAWIGGAVTRMAAVRFAREESVPMGQALAFSCRKWLSLVTSPLIPFGVLVLVALGVGVLTGVPMMVPYVGEVVMSLLFFLTLIMGLVMALIFVGGAFSVGLQWPTIAAEGSDSFDAISRSVAYISSRPWRYLFYTVFSIFYGCLTFIFVKFVALLTLTTTHYAVSAFTWNWKEAGDKLPRLWQQPTWANPWPASGGEAWASTDVFATVVISIWVWVVLGLVISFLISFALTSQTVIYFLLRRSVDATDIEEVYMEEAEEEELPIEHQPEPAPERPAPASEGEGAPEAEAPPPPEERESEGEQPEEGETPEGP